jgi:sugar (pentulose or hexulose) kinase
MSQVQVLALDIGAESGRAIVGTLRENRIELEEVHRFSNLSVRLPDGLHWEILYLFNEIIKGIKAGVERTRDQLVGVGLDTWGVDHALLNQAGSLTYLPFHYRDSRTDDRMEKVFKTISKTKIFEETGVQFMSINTLYQLAELIDSNPASVESADTFLTIPDLLNFWLTGKKVCEYSIATTTQLYNPVNKDWAWPLIDAIGAPREIFPEIVPSGTNLGNLLPHVANFVGSEKLTVIAPACHDTGSAVLAVPFENELAAYLSSGTWSLLGLELDEPVINETTLAMNFTNEGGFGGTIRFLKNITGLWIIQECRRYWNSIGDLMNYTEITQLAEQAQPFVCILDTEYAEFLKPGDMPNKIKRYAEMTGQTIPQTKGEIVRCVLESLAMKYREEFEKMEQVAGQTIEKLNIVGGGTQNKLLNQFAANALNRTVITGPIEATAMGNILGQLITLGEILDVETAREIVKNSFDLETYTPTSTMSWDSAYQDYRRLLNLD